MINILQDPTSRKWGIRITEDLGGLDLRSGGTNSFRSLLEEYSFNSPAEVMPFCQAFQRSMSIGRYRMRREGGIWLYEVAYPESNEIMYSEGGWMDQTELDSHIKLLAVHCQGFPKIANVAKTVNMSLGDRPKTAPVGSEFEDWSKVDNLMKEDDSEVVPGAGW